MASCIFVVVVLVFLPCLATSEGQEVFDGPTSPAVFRSWFQSLLDWRAQTVRDISYQGGVFSLVNWTSTSFIQAQMHPYDRFFYDSDKQAYTVKKYLKDLRDRYGGVDSILLWPTYPVIGIDDRNQYDYFRAMPGGLDGLKEVIAELHDENVRVLLPYNPWDSGTRDEGSSDAETLAHMLKAIKGDGFNGDTLMSIDKEFWDAAMSLDYPIALEPEGVYDYPHDIYTNYTNWGTMGWGYWWPYDHIPEVDRWKWLDSRRMTNICNRWAKLRIDEIQHAYFNAIGYVSWENIWGIWNGVVPYDGESLRRVSSILRYFGGLGLTQAKDWVPHTPVINGDNIFASKFSLNGESVWFLINRGDQDIQGNQMTINNTNVDTEWYDCYHGHSLVPTSSAAAAAASVTLAFDMEAHGYGCVFASTKRQQDQEFKNFMNTMHSMTVSPLSSYMQTWQYMMQSMVPIPSTPKASSAPKGMIHIPPTPSYNFVVSGVEIEGKVGFGVDVQFPWEPYPMRDHSHVMKMDGFYIDKYPVTCAEYAEYLRYSGYTPKDNYNYLKNWNGTSVPLGYEKKPVTYVSLQEARDYCDYYGKRLPHVYEWQYAAQGTDGRLYPWGNVNDQSRYPVQSSARIIPGPADVDAFVPHGDSPFGVSDMIGNVWQYTDEFQDDHTAAVVLRGSANYRPTASMWYFPNALELNKQNKMFVMSASYERAGTVGFRCVVDA